MKKTIRIMLSVLTFCILFTCTSYTASAAVRKGLHKINNSYYYYYNNGKKLTDAWKTINGKRYYFTAKGYAAKNGERNVRGKIYVFDKNSNLCKGTKKRVVKVNGNYYYVNPNGTVNKGWIIDGNNLYYGDSRGRLLKNKVYQSVTFQSNAKAKMDYPGLCKKKVMTVVKSITNSSMTKEEKLRKCWNYLVHNGFRYYLTGDPYVYSNGWWHEFAFDTLESYGGNCYGFACAFAALAKEIGYEAYLVCGRVPGSRDGAPDGFTRHCWVQINGAFYDPEAHFAGWAYNIYGTGYPMSYQVQRLVKFV